MHAAALPAGWKLPARHRAQAAEPAGAAEPGTQAAHTAGDVALTAPEAEPAGHGVHWPAPALLYEPAAHPRQGPPPGEYSPAAHGEQSPAEVELGPAVEEPAAQGVHEVALLTGLKVPTGQSAHSKLEAKEPGGQSGWIGVGRTT